MLFCPFSEATPYPCGTSAYATAQLTSLGLTRNVHIAASGDITTIVAVYSGTKTYTGSQSAAGTITQSVPVASTSTTISATGGPPSPYSLSATVTATGYPGAMGGNVAFITESNQTLAEVPVISHGVYSVTNQQQITSNSCASGAITAAAAGDFNGDGFPDVAYGCQGANGITLRLGAGFTQTASPSNYDKPVLGLASGDLNNDGYLDLIAVSNGVIDVLNGVGNGTFTTGHEFTLNSGDTVNTVKVGDFNNDGLVDVAFTTGSGLYVYLNSAKGFSSAPVFTPGVTEYFTLGDFNRDGKVDIAANTGSYGNSGLQVLLGAGDGTFVPRGGAYSAYGTSVAATDMNRDGKIDLVTGDGSVLLGVGDGTFQFGPPVPSIDPLNENNCGGQVDALREGGVFLTSSEGDHLNDQWAQTCRVTPDPAGNYAVVVSNVNFAQASDGWTVLQSLGATVVGDFDGNGATDYMVVLNDTTDGSTQFTEIPFIGVAQSTVTAGNISVPTTTNVTALYGPGNSPYTGSESSPIQLTGAGKTTPTLTWANPASISYGTKLSSAQLDAKANVAGTFAYSPSYGVLLGVGRHTLSVRFTPTNTTLYNTATKSVTLTVTKAIPTLTWATPASIKYGTRLSSKQLDAHANVGGKFVYTPSYGALLSKGKHTLSVKFTPSSTTDYNPAYKSVTIDVY